MEPASMFRAVELRLPRDLHSVPGISGVKERYTEYEYKIYGLNDTNTLYTAHDFDIHTLLSQPGSGAGGLPFAPLPSSTAADPGELISPALPSSSAPSPASWTWTYFKKLTSGGHSDGGTATPEAIGVAPPNKIMLRGTFGGGTAMPETTGNSFILLSFRRVSGRDT